MYNKINQASNYVSRLFRCRTSNSSTKESKVYTESEFLSDKKVLTDLVTKWDLDKYFTESSTHLDILNTLYRMERTRYHGENYLDLNKVNREYHNLKKGE